MAMESEMGVNTIIMISLYCGLFAAVKAALAQPYQWRTLEKGPRFSDFPIKTSIYKGVSGLPCLMTPENMYSLNFIDKRMMQVGVPP